MGVRAIVMDADPAVTDGNVEMVVRSIGDAMTKQIKAARQIYKETGQRFWDSAAQAEY